MFKEDTIINQRAIHKKLNLSYEEILKDYKLCVISREMSLQGRKEVLTGKAKFGIFGAGKEVAQVAMAHAFRKGDFRSGYYRDQTFMLALGLSTIEDLYAQLYADAENDPFSGGRQMNSHFATPLIDENENWLKHKDLYNVSADVSNTAGQMPRSLGLALASQKYKENKILDGSDFSNDGQEVSFVTIGDASTSEGVFWETLNAAGVMQVPLAVSVWDDGFGISVPKKYQTIKESISTALSGFNYDKNTKKGIDIYYAKGWDYEGLVDLYKNGVAKIRKHGRPALFHIDEVTQPQGHSTSGSHERYKTAERLNWESEYDAIVQMERWILSEGISTEEELQKLKMEARDEVKRNRQTAWKNYQNPLKIELQKLRDIYAAIDVDNPDFKVAQKDLESLYFLSVRDLLRNARKVQFALLADNNYQSAELNNWIKKIEELAHKRYHTHLYSEAAGSALAVKEIAPEYSNTSKVVNGYEVLNKFFSIAFERYPQLYAFGEDVGDIGGVNQGFAGLQDKFGESRIFDTGIREATIVGQSIGMAMRGLRPIAEIQYLDYLIYGLQPMMDDLATLRYRSNGQQHAPAIIRTRGHRLEGIWHSGSPIAMVVNTLKGMHVLAPRDMTRAVGMYNTLLQSNDPALIIECLNGYRRKETLPDNIGDYTVPLGVPEVLKEGDDVTLVTYGSSVRVAEEGIEMLEKRGISVELIDVQTLMPFDINHTLVESLKKTNKIVFMDEDMPGGATAYMMRELLEVQGGYQWLDAQPVCLSAAGHRPPYGDDGDYFTKPNPENVFVVVYRIMHESDPVAYPAVF